MSEDGAEKKAESEYENQDVSMCLHRARLNEISTTAFILRLFL